MNILSFMKWFSYNNLWSILFHVTTSTISSYCIAYLSLKSCYRISIGMQDIDNSELEEHYIVNNLAFRLKSLFKEAIYMAILFDFLIHISFLEVRHITWSYVNSDKNISHDCL